MWRLSRNDRMREEACTERAPALPAFRHARRDLLACSPVLIAGGRQPNKRLLLRQNRIIDPVVHCPEINAQMLCNRLQTKELTLTLLSFYKTDR